MLYSLTLKQLNNNNNNNYNGINEKKDMIINDTSNSLLRKINLTDETIRKLKQFSAYSNLVPHIDKRDFKYQKSCNRNLRLNWHLNPSYFRCLMELTHKISYTSQIKKLAIPALTAKKPKLATTTRRTLNRF